VGHKIRYVVASLPRSGTKYISLVLDKMGLNCSHEGWLNNLKCETFSNRSSDVWGDVSWMAAPHIAQLPAGTVVFHQLRDPIKVLNSNLPPGGDSYFRTWDKNAGLDSDPLYKKHLPWKRFIWEQTQDWVWPNGVSEEAESPEEIERLIFWWANWNLWIESAAMQRADLVYVRYKLEDMDGELLKNIAHVIQPDIIPPRLQHCENILKEVPTTVNRHRTPNNRITAGMLPPAARLLMYRYGYSE